MGREVRMVPPGWEHPRLDDGQCRPLYPDFSEALEMYARDQREDPPRREDFMPEWPPGIATHYRMYETCSEGTPISPPMATQEDLARWLADNGASAFADDTASYEAWLSTIRRGSVCSAVLIDGHLVSGAESLK